MKNLKERIKLHEGYRNTVYKDTLGFRTIGYGHKVTHTDDFVEGREYPKEQLDEILAKKWISKLEESMKQQTFFGMCPYITYIYEV